MNGFKHSIHYSIIVLRWLKVKTNKEKIIQMIDEITLLKEINLADIPSVDLYMDQITTFFDDKLKHLKRDENDVILTKTMINNYTKSKALMPPNKKKYSKEHLILLVLIYHLKQVLSIHDTQLLLSPIVTNIHTEDKINLDGLYTAFLEFKEMNAEEFKTDIEEKINIIIEKSEKTEQEGNDSTDFLLLVLMLINQANLHKRMAEKLIDQFFQSEKQDKRKK